MSALRWTMGTEPDGRIVQRIKNVAVLYVDPKGPYPELVSLTYDVSRDAAQYAGPWPIVAHPPCGPWGPMRHQSSGRGPEQDKHCGPVAVALVRRWGGVLEHPQGSTLFRYLGLPHPGELPDAYGGVTYKVSQCDWGHVARKWTWLYVVGLRDSIPTAPAKREPTHWASGGRSRSARKQGSPVPAGIKVCSAQQRRRTPTDFARWLVELASRCAAPVLSNGTPKEGG